MTGYPNEDPRERRLGDIASRFSYPFTPDLSRPVSGRLGSRRPSLHLWQAIVVAVVLLLAAVLAIPQARSLIAGYFRIGAVRILPFRPSPTPQPTLTPTLAATPSVTRAPSVSPTVPLPPVPAALEGLAGLTTLQEAQKSFPFPIMLPSGQADLGPPDYVYYQPSFPMLILAWTEPSDPSRLRLSLYEIDSNSPMVSKFAPEIIRETSVSGNYAVWAKGPYLVELTNQGLEQRRLVEGATLIWEVNGVTYRLESGLSLEQAVQIAESLKPLEP